jgi:menaquinone-9 beta-reductase
MTLWPFKAAQTRVASRPPGACQDTLVAESARMNSGLRSTDVFDVFIVGGGPAGLAAAIAARRQGFEVAIADCSVPPIDKACGEGIMPDGLAAARALGIDIAAEEVYPFRGICFCEDGVSVEANFPRGAGAGLRRTALHRILMRRAAAAGVRMFWGARVKGISNEGVSLGGEVVRARWIIGADGGESRVRRWAGLEACSRASHRFGFRRHYQVAPWSDLAEIHWSAGCQLYITPIGAKEICVALISRDPRLHLNEALPRFPGTARRLRDAPHATPERGGVTATRRLKAVCRGRVALIGDASGSVDAVTGEGLCLLFQQASALAQALRAEDLSLYQAEHRRLGRRPRFMAGLMLLMDRRSRLRRRVMRALASNPRVFADMLAAHVGEASPLQLAGTGMALGWSMLTV